jgi:hypothetical protein
MFTAKQHSLLSGFSYQIFDAANQQVGTVQWPLHPQAKNARLKIHNENSKLGNIKIEINAKSYDISFEYLSRDWNNDIRFSLYDQQHLLGLADVIKSAKRFTRPEIKIAQPFEGTIVRSGSLFAIRYEVKARGNAIGTIAQPKLFSLKRELLIDLPNSISPEFQLFMLFLVCNDAFR